MVVHSPRYRVAGDDAKLRNKGMHDFHDSAFPFPFLFPSFPVLSPLLVTGRGKSKA